jgi:hypothetical protein
MLRPGQKKARWEIELSDAKARRRYGLKLVQGSLQIGAVSADDTVYIRNVGKRIGDFDEQRNWKMGRGSENLSESPDAYWDGNNIWTLTEGHVHQTLQWYHARGLRNEEIYMPTRDAGDVKFQPLLGSSLYISNSFSASASYLADKGFLWIRRIGSPGTLTIRLMSNSGGNPNAALQTVTKTVSDITDYVSVYQVFDWTGTESLSSSTTYHVSIHGASTDDVDNHWEVGVNPDSNSGKISSDGSSWSDAGFAMYYRIVSFFAAHNARRWYRFVLKEAFYIIDRKDDNSTASVLYINGDRGKATAGASTTLTDSVKAWVVNRWQGAWVKIVGGTGIRNEPRKIASNTATELTISGTWETTPSTDTEYIIYATEWFTQIIPTGGSLSVCQNEPVVANNVAYIPQGPTGIAHLQWNNSTLAHDLSVESASGVNGLADIVITTNDPADGPVLWRANNRTATGSGGYATVSRANLLTSGAFVAWNTALSFKTAIFTGGGSAQVTGLRGKDSQVYAFREDGLGIIVNDRYVNIETGIEKTPSRNNGFMSLVHGQFMYYSWLNSVVRMYGSTHDDIGDDFRGIGLPDGREGAYIDGDTYMKLDLFGVDPGPNTTNDLGKSTTVSAFGSVLAWDGLGWHEILRGRTSGERVRMVKVQTNEGTRNRLWINQGGDLTFQEFPLAKSSPRLDTGARYMHEGVLESAAIDMGTASGLQKYINELAVTVKNLNTAGRNIFVDIQVDDDVHTTNWTPVVSLTRSPESIARLGLESIHRFAYRLRLCTDDNTTPIDVEGVIPSGYARTPFKLVWSMQVQAGKRVGRRGGQATADEIVKWLLDESRVAGGVWMESVFHMASHFRVIIHPPHIFPLTMARGKNPEVDSFTISLQEV